MMPGMRPEDVYELTSVGDPRLSPDGTGVAYTVTTVDPEEREYRSSVWVVATDGSSPPRRLAGAGKRDAAPRWSPDGRRLAFTSDRDGDDERKPQLHVLPMDGGDPVRLTDLPEAVSEVAWSPDGSRLAFTSRVRDAAYEEEDERRRPPRRFTRLRYKLDDVGWTGDRPKHLFVVEADGSADPVQITDGDAEDSAPAWSPDGRSICFVSARHDDWDVDPVNDLYLVPPDGGAPDRLTATDGSVAEPSWSPDGRRIAYQYSPGRFDDPRHTRIAVLDVSTRERRVLTESLDRNCAPFRMGRGPLWMPGDRLLFGVEDAGNTHLYTVPADGSGEPEAVVDGDLRVAGYDAADETVTHIVTTPTTLPEVFCGERRLTDHGVAFAEERDLVAPERFTATAPDGAEVEAWVMRPAGFEEGRRYPVLLNIHGGPFTQYGNGFFDEFQVYTEAGYVVLYANPRGSSGYSEAWGRAIRGPAADAGPGWGTRDYDDLMAVVDEALERFDFCDPERRGVLGGSYGGWMTSWIVAHTDRFQAACSERAVNSWYSMWGSSDIGWTFRGYMGAFLHEAPDVWLRMSPATYATEITTPLLILHSENDLRCPAEQAEQLFTTLRLLGRDVELVRFPAEGHELSRSGAPTHRVQRFEVVLDWFERKLR